MKTFLRSKSFRVAAFFLAAAFCVWSGLVGLRTGKVETPSYLVAGDVISAARRPEIFHFVIDAWFVLGAGSFCLAIGALFRSTPQRAKSVAPAVPAVPTVPSVSTTPVATVCPACKAPVGTPYRLLSAPVKCAACGRTVVPEIPNGTLIHNTGYEIRFSDFTRLLSDATNRRAVAPLLERWFACSIVPEDKGFKIVGADGVALEPLMLHLQIQDDDTKRYEIYQTAMDLWR